MTQPDMRKPVVTVVVDAVVITHPLLLQQIPAIFTQKPVAEILIMNLAVIMETSVLLAIQIVSLR
jgi:hypothetical protein